MIEEMHGKRSDCPNCRRRLVHQLRVSGIVFCNESCARLYTRKLKIWAKQHQAKAALLAKDLGMQCPDCQGSGQQLRVRVHTTGAESYTPSPCPSCHGEGLTLTP